MRDDGSRVRSLLVQHVGLSGEHDLQVTACGEAHKYVVQGCTGRFVYLLEYKHAFGLITQHLIPTQSGMPDLSP